MAFRFHERLAITYLIIEKTPTEINNRESKNPGHGAITT